MFWKVWNKHDYTGNAPDFNGSQISVMTGGFEILIFLHEEAVTLNSAPF